MGRSRFWIVLSAAAVVVPSSGLADPPIKLPDVVVDGRRFVDDEAAPSTVITRSDMTETITDLPGILDEQPGLRAPQYGGLGSFTALRIRGSTTDQVRVVVDGIPLNSAEGGPVDLSTLPLGPLDAVVIYRGVSPVRFGGSAIGGVVDIHTRALGRQSIEVEVAGGSFGTRMARAFYGRGNETWGIGVSLDYLGGQGDFGFLNDQGTLFDTSDDVEVDRRNNAFDRLSGMAKGHVNLADGVTLRLLNLL
ncbi:MAG: iron complex outermembrane receptor protein, partial [Myxococcota bacterium]